MIHKKTKICIIAAAVAILLILILCRHLQPESQGIIGSADGPTSIIISD